MMWWCDDDDDGDCDGVGDGDDDAHDDCKCGATSGLRVGANMFKLFERCIYIYIIAIII